MNANYLCSIARVAGFVALATFAASCGGGAGPLGTAAAAQNGVPRSNAATKTQQKLYVTNVNGGVLVYSAGPQPQLLQTITDGASRPFCDWVDGKGFLYIINMSNGTDQANLAEYKPGASSPFFTIASGIPNPGAIAADASQDVFVAGVLQGSEAPILQLYPPGSSTPSQTLTVPTLGEVSAAESLTFDPSGNLLLGVDALPKRDTDVLRLAPGSQEFTHLGLKKMPGALIAADAAGNLYVGGGGMRIAVYSPGATTPERFIRLAGPHPVSALTVDQDGTLYVGSGPYVYEFAPGARKPSSSFDSNALIGGLALSPK
jgi:hypothetical protein